jgi:hypothetical protein
MGPSGEPGVLAIRMEGSDLAMYLSDVLLILYSSLPQRNRTHLGNKT